MIFIEIKLDNFNTQYLIFGLNNFALRFRRYVVEVTAFNALGESPPSRPPLFVYVGFVIPTQKVQNFSGEVQKYFKKSFFIHLFYSFYLSHKQF